MISLKKISWDAEGHNKLSKARFGIFGKKIIERQAKDSGNPAGGKNAVRRDRV